MGTIYVEPQRGLCNKLRVIVSAYSIAKQYNKKLVVLWTSNHECNCSLDKLFDLPEDIKVYNLSRNGIKNRIYGKIIRTVAKLSEYRIYDQEVVKAVSDISLQKKYYENSKNIYIHTCESLLGSGCILDSRHDFTIIQPKADILTKVNAIIRSKDYVGVHIRRTDNVEAIARSSNEAFVNSMQQELRTDSETKFFVATDANDVKIMLKSTFGDDCISTKESVLDRNSEQGIIDAFIELVCLSRCRKIIGSFYSSFSEVAAAMGKIEIVVAGGKK